MTPIQGPRDGPIRPMRRARARLPCQIDQLACPQIAVASDYLAPVRQRGGAQGPHLSNCGQTGGGSALQNRGDRVNLA